MRTKILSWAVILAFDVITLALQASQVELVPTGSSWKYVLGTQEASSPIDAWRAIGFNDTTWTSAQAPIGYGEPDIVGTLPASSVANYLTVYLRKTFVVDNPANYSDLNVMIRIDDGYVAWINGVEVGRYNVPVGELYHDSAAVGAFEPTVTTFTATNMLVPGTNVLAVLMLNANLTSSDLLLDASVSATVDDIAPTVVALNPIRNAIVRELNTVEVTFSEPVDGVDAADLLINGAAATNLVFLSPSAVKFTFTQPPTGTVQVAWAANHGIHDKAATPNAFVGDSWSYTLDPNAAPANFLLNEFLAANSGNLQSTNTIRDEDGDSSDWIEIYNASDTQESLAGWFLTDTTNNLTKWRFPSVTMAPRSYLIVFASGKNRTNALGRLHTNFQLGSGGEYLGLLDPRTNVVSDFYPVFPPQTTDVSYGRDRGDPQLVGYFNVPTPGGPNSSTGAGFGPEVVFSVNSTTFSDPFMLELSTPGNTNAEIHYTVVTNTAALTNAPTASSPLYTNAITINRTAQVRARAFLPGTSYFPGPVHSESYIQMSNNVANFSSTLPIVVFHTVGSASVSGGYPSLETPVVIALYDNKYGYSSLSNAPDKILRGGFNIRGSSTAGYPKQSYAVETWDEYNDGKGVEFLGLPQESDWVFYAPNYFDRIMLHNPLAYKISNEVGRYGSRTRYVEVFLNTSGTMLSANMAGTGSTMGNYYGVYVLEEKIKRDKHRVDIEPLQPEMTNAPAITGGYMLKVDRQDANETGITMANQGMVWVYPGGLEMATLRRGAQSNYIRNYFNDFYTALTGASATNPLTGYAAYIDVDSWIDHHIVNVVTLNADAFRLSGFFYKNRDKKIEYGPVWDFDRALGTGDGSNNDYRAFNPRCWMGATGYGGGTDFGTDFFNSDGTFANPWYSRLFRFPDFWQAWIDRYQELRQTSLSTNNLLGMVDRFADDLRAVAPRNQARWAGQGTASDPTPRNGTISVAASIRGPIPYSYVFNGTFQREVDFQKQWFMDRMQFINTNLLNPPSLSTPPGLVQSNSTVVISDNSGEVGTVVLYTLDGTDPRAPGGAIAPNARTNTGAITISNNIRVVARAYNPNHRNVTGTGNPPISSPWSGPAAGTYYLKLPALRITELMYHPAPASTGDTNDADIYEYIELKNTGSTALNLAGFRLRGGVEFDFPNLVLAAGQTCVVVANTNAFAERYGTAGVLIAGQYTGNLDNGGERLVLEGPVREPILDFSYSDEWYPITDGFGFSLVIMDDTAPVDTWGLASSWRASSGLNGSPGLPNPAPAELPTVFINEALTHTDPPMSDAIELYNPGAANANIGGWFLTDDFREPQAYRIADGTVVPAGGYLVLYATNTFGSVFLLSSKGDAVYLFSGDGTNLTGYVHGFDFGAQFNGVTFGRYVISTGNDHFVTQRQETLGQPNAGPKVGPIVISEILYRPVDFRFGDQAFDNDLDEYIELQNIGSQPVPLYDPAFPTNRWRLQDAVDYEFPAGTTIPAGGYALVVNFNPTNDMLASSFRSRFAVPAEVPLFGPYSGKLNNDGENIELMQPEQPENQPGPDFGSVSYVLVERIGYKDTAPWPMAANGVGPSLQRLVVSDYGNDPTNWIAAAPSPGRPYGGGTLPTITVQPVSQTVVGNTTASFSVAAEGTGPFSYQWLFNGATIYEATNATLDLPGVKVTQAGLYQVVVLNSAGAVVSSNATLAVLVPVVITQQPLSRSVRPGTNVTFIVAAYSSRLIDYQWLFNGTPIADATNNTYSITNVQPAQDGMYQVRVSDAISTDLSQAVRLAVLVEPWVIVQPASTFLTVGETLNLYVQATNTATLPILFRWRRSATTFLGHLSSSSREDTLTLPNVQVTNSGYYSVVVTNEARTGGAASSNAFVAVVSPPLDQVAAIGGNATFNVTVGYPGRTVLYQWQLNGADILNATTNVLTISNVQPAQLGTYGVVIKVVTNTTTSEGFQTLFTASLGLPAQDTDGDGMPDDWENQYACLQVNTADASADPDGDGMTNLQEYLAGTDPCNRDSYLKVELVRVEGIGVTNVVLRFGAVSNKTYTVQYQNLLNPTGSWTRLQNIAGAPTNRTVEVLDASPGAAARYYRLATPQQP